jgi:hypothetical protein
MLRDRKKTGTVRATFASRPGIQRSPDRVHRARVRFACACAARLFINKPLMRCGDAARPPDGRDAQRPVPPYIGGGSSGNGSHGRKATRWYLERNQACCRATIRAIWLSMIVFARCDCARATDSSWACLAAILRQKSRRHMMGASKTATNAAMAMTCHTLNRTRR